MHYGRISASWNVASTCMSNYSISKPCLDLITLNTKVENISQQHSTFILATHLYNIVFTELVTIYMKG